MKLNVISLIVVASLATAFSIQDTQASDMSGRGNQRFSVSELKKQITAPRIYSVEAYIIHMLDKCAPCPPNAVCESCLLGIYISDDSRPRKPNIRINNRIFLRTGKTSELKVGIKYLFKIRYQVELNAGGAWVQTGPELIGYESMVSSGNREQSPNKENQHGSK